MSQHVALKDPALARISPAGWLKRIPKPIVHMPTHGREVERRRLALTSALVYPPPRGPGKALQGLLPRARIIT